MIMRLRSRGISDIHILRAIECLPRRYFVAPDFIDLCYDEFAVPIACGQSLIPPLNVAMMLQFLDVKPDHKVLLVGVGTGYMAAILSHLCVRVYGVERYKTLVEQSESTLKKLQIHNVVLRHGDGFYGWPGQAPFSRILLAGAVKTAPRRLLSQLEADGKLLAIMDGTLCQWGGEGGNHRALLPLSIPMLEPGKSKAL